MKKIIVSMMLVAWFASPASAGGKHTKGKSVSRQAVCTGACINHSMDGAYSERWADQARSPEPGTHFKLTPSNNIRITSVNGRSNYYNINDFTVIGTRRYRNVTQNSPYQGEDAPSYDGHVKNEYRNMRANNTSEPLPSNDGQYSRR